MEEKKKYWQQPGDIQGFGQAFVVSEEQKLDWGDLFVMYTIPTYLRKPHLFPKLLPHQIRDTLEADSAELRNLALKILYQMAKALKMDPNDIKDLFEGVQIMGMNYYPPCPQPELVMGLSSHSDASGLTILLQTNEMDGLQIKKDGLWVPSKALPDAFIVNIGDALEIVTNGFYPAACCAMPLHALA